MTIKFTMWKHENTKNLGWVTVKRTYEFNKGLVTVASDIAFRVNNFAERFAEVEELFFAALPRQVAKMKDLGWRLSVSKLSLSCARGHGHGNGDAEQELVSSNRIELINRSIDRSLVFLSQTTEEIRRRKEIV